jgi:hypothetical protein
VPVAAPPGPFCCPFPSIRKKSICSGTFAAEGVDYDVATGVPRVEIIQQRHDHEPVPAGR